MSLKKLQSTFHSTAVANTATGLPGATATPITLAGGTTSGPPSSGTHEKGEVVWDDSGTYWYCSVAGTPGTWVTVESLGIYNSENTYAVGDTVIYSNILYRKVNSGTYEPGDQSAAIGSLFLTSTVIDAETTAPARQVRTLLNVNDNIYLGYGDLNANTGPVQILSFDHGNTTVTNEGGGNFGSEEVRYYNPIGTQVWAMALDPRESGGSPHYYGRVSAPGGSWTFSIPGSLGTLQHVHGVMSGPNADQFILIAERANGLGNDAVAYVSDDDGATWSVGAEKITVGSLIQRPSGGGQLGNKRFVRLGTDEATFWQFDGSTWTDLTTTHAAISNSIFDQNNRLGAVEFNGRLYWRDGSVFSRGIVAWDGISTNVEGIVSYEYANQFLPGDEATHDLMWIKKIGDRLYVFDNLTNGSDLGYAVHEISPDGGIIKTLFRLEDAPSSELFPNDFTVSLDGSTVYFAMDEGEVYSATMDVDWPTWEPVFYPHYNNNVLNHDLLANNRSIKGLTNLQFYQTDSATTADVLIDHETTLDPGVFAGYQIESFITPNSINGTYSLQNDTFGADLVSSYSSRYGEVFTANSQFVAMEISVSADDNTSTSNAKLLLNDFAAYARQDESEVLVAESGYFVTPTKRRTVTSSETLVINDAGKSIDASHATVAIVLTVPTNASVAFRIGSRVYVRRTGAAVVTFTPSGGVTIRNNTAALPVQYSSGYLEKVGTNEWDWTPLADQAASSVRVDDTNIPTIGSGVSPDVQAAIENIDLVLEDLYNYSLPAATGGTYGADISVPDEAYGAGWNASLEVPTKNAVYDKVESLTATDIDFTPTGGIAATNVSGALGELDTETVKLTGNQTIAGDKDFSDELTKQGHNVRLSHSKYEGITCYIYGASDSADPATYSTPGNHWWQKVQRRLGLGEVINRAVNGYDIREMASSAIGTYQTGATWVSGSRGIVFVSFGGGELIQGHVTNSAVQTTIQHELRSMLATLGASAIVESSAFTAGNTGGGGGAWTTINNTISSSGSHRTSSTLNDTLTHATAFTGDAVNVHYVTVDNTVVHGRDAEVRVDGGGVSATINPETLASVANWGHAHGSVGHGVVQLDGFGAGTHSLEFRAVGLSGGSGTPGFATLDFVSIPSPTPPKVFVIIHPAIQDYDASETERDIIMGIAQTVCAEFDYVTLIDPNVGWPTDESYVGADGVHWIDLGETAMADRVEEAMIAETDLGFTAAATYDVYAHLAKAKDTGSISRMHGGLASFQAHPAMGSTETFDLGIASNHSGILDANCTFTFTGAVENYDCRLRLYLVQDATGGRTVTWPGTMVGTIPQPNPIANSWTTYEFITGTGGAAWLLVSFSNAQPSRTIGSSLGTSGTVNLDLAALNNTYQTISLSGNITFTTSNRAANRTVTFKILADGSTRTFTFPSWIFVGTAAPANIAAGKTAILTITSFGTADTDIVADYSVQP